MYDITKRQYFTTLKELRDLLANEPDDTEVCICGQSGSWLHFAKEGNLICLDSESLYDDYVENEVGDPDLLSELEEAAEMRQRDEHAQRLLRAEKERRKSDSFKAGVIAEVDCAWPYKDKNYCLDDIYSFVLDGEYERRAFWIWCEDECCYPPDTEDIIDNANRIQMIRDEYLDLCDNGEIFGKSEAAFSIDDDVIAGAFCVDDGSWDYTIFDPGMKVIESGQLSFDCQYSAHEAVIEILKSCGLSYQEMVPIPFEQFKKMCNKEICDA